MSYVRLEPFLPNPDLTISEQSAESLFAMCLWGEARGQSMQAKVAVAHVILNRVKAKPGRFYPNNGLLSFNEKVRRVILKPWQFSCFNGNDPNVTKMLRPDANDTMLVWSECLLVAAGAMGQHPMFRDPTIGADHYYSPAYGKSGEIVNTPNWADGQTPTCILPGFRFYRIG